MTKATNNVARVAAAVAGLGLIAVSFAPMAGAQTSTTTTTTTTTASVSFSRDLRVGSSGADVSALQTWLIAQGFSIKAGATGFFGGQTKAAVKAFQVANGITPASGYFGPITRAKVAAMGGSSSTGSTVPGCAAGAAFSSTTGQPCASGSSSTGSLSGGEGSIDNLQVLGSPSNTTLYQGQTQQVFGVKFQADGSDLSVNRVDFDVTNNGIAVNGGTGQDRPWAVLQTATLYDGSNVIGTVDASNMNNWSQDGNLLGIAHQTYRLRFGGMNDVVKMGSQANYYLAFTAQNGISNANQTQFSIALANQGIRATDSKGINQYSGSNTNGTAQLVSVSNAAAGTIVFSTGSDNPQASTVMANQSAATQNVVLGTFTINSQNAATMLYTLPVTLTVNQSASATPVQDLKLVANGVVLDSEAITSSQSWASTTYNGQAASSTTVTFKNMNLTMPINTTQSFQIKADINPTGGSNSGNAAEGSFAQVAITSFTGSDIEQGSNRITPTGSVAGNQITFHVNGAAVDATPSTASAAASAVGTSGTQQGNYTFTFNVTAYGQDVFVSKNAATAIAYSLLSNGSPSGVSSTTVSLSSLADNSNSGNNYDVHAGQSKQFTVLVTVPAGNNTSINAKLSTLNYALTDATTANSASTPFNNNYQTAPIFLHS